MFSGGISDKFGNAYEALWAARQLLHVFDGRKKAIHLEGINSDFKGFEFSVDEGGFKSWHQTKINAQGQNWTVRALEREGVLAAFKARLTASPDDRCVFVSQSPAVDLVELAAKAALANGFDDFNGALLPTPRKKFDAFCVAADIQPDVAFDWLKRCDFLTLPQSEIKAIVEDTAGPLFQNEKTAVFPALRAFLEDRLNRELTTEAVRVDLPAATELRIKDWSLRPTLKERLQEETSNYLATFTSFAGTAIPFDRPELDTLSSLLADPEGPQVVMVSGVAGSGKSGLVRALLGRLADEATPHLAFRVDQHLDCKTPEAFGKDLLGTSESPVTVLKGLSPLHRTVLVVDQLDALSEISGRNGVSKVAVLRLIEEARRLETVRVVLVCRTFDMENDERLKLLKKSDDFKQIELPLLNWDRDIAPILVRLSVDVNDLDRVQRDLLLLPLNLALFSEIAETGDLAFSSRSQLFDKLIEKKARQISERRDGEGWALMRPLVHLSRWMSARQKLDAPFGVLDDFSRSLEILASENLITKTKSTVSFFHESFFDYVFARSFAAGEQTLLELLKSTEQHLFRRTQIRQILETLRESDESRYLQELSQVLNSADVRFHIKIALAKWLAALPIPTAREREIVLNLDAPGQPFPLLVRTVIQGSPGWFDILAENGWLKRQLASPVDQRRRALMWWLESRAGDRPQEIAALLDQWWSGEPARGLELLDWFSHAQRAKPHKALVDLCTRVMASKPKNLFDRNSLRSELLIAAWVADETIEGSSAILKAYFDAWFALHDKGHPFTREEIKEIDIHSLSEFCKKKPLAFVEGVLDALNLTVTRIAEAHDAGERDHTFAYRFVGEGGGGSERFLNLVRMGLSRLAIESPAEAARLLDRLDPTRHEAVMHLVLETIAANPAALHARLPPLLGSDVLLEAGWDGARWKSFADAAAGSLAFLTESSKGQVEDFILSQYPEIDLAKEAAAELSKSGNRTPKVRDFAMRFLRDSGFRQYCILTTIGPQWLGPRARTRLAELERKFHGQEMGKPSESRVTTVKSPIPHVKAALMSDKDWLRAIEVYQSEERPRFSDKSLGGARELAQVLQKLSKDQPVRAVRLLRKIPEHSNAVYVECLLQGLVENENFDEAELGEAIAFVQKDESRPHGDVICRAYYNHPELCRQDGHWDFLVWYIRRGRAPDTSELSDTFAKQELVTIENLVERAGSLHIRGINSVRGWAFEALAQVLWWVPERRSQAWVLIEERIAEERNPSVRCCLVEALIPLFNENRERCARLLRLLIDTHADISTQLTPLVTRPATRLLPYIVLQVPEIGRQLLEIMGRSSNENIRLVAAWHVMRLSYHEQGYVDWSEDIERTKPITRQLAAELAAEAVADATLRDRALAKTKAYFTDLDRECRLRAARTFNGVARDQIEVLLELADDFLESEAFFDDSFPFLHFVEEAQGDVAGLVIAAAERVLSLVGDASPDMSGHDLNLHQIQELLSKEYGNSEYRPELRKRILDVLDRMLMSEMRGTDEIVNLHER